YTHAGVHRADIRIRINNVNAAETLSRGQQKLLVCALKIAQGVVFEKLTQRKCLYLVDDLPAELDGRHRGILVNWLNKLDTQVFITGVEREALLEPWRVLPERPTKVFHVERGRIIQEDKMPV
ncbi:MAG TPA: DNA replication and repair protein RecF, partial [Cellvibrionaceae bacterium]